MLQGLRQFSLLLYQKLYLTTSGSNLICFAKQEESMTKGTPVSRTVREGTLATSTIIKEKLGFWNFSISYIKSEWCPLVSL